MMAVLDLARREPAGTQEARVDRTGFRSLTPAEFGERVRAVAGSDGPEHALTLTVELVGAVVECDHASITLVRADQTLETVASSDETAEAADALQYELSEGPCVAAAIDGAMYVVPETATDSRFPHWGPRVASEVGLHSVLSLRLFTSRDALGALNIYAASPRSFGEPEIESAHTVAAHASVALARARSERNLWAAIESRHLIGQAQGMLIERYRITPEQAFAVLKRYSQATNHKLVTIAADLLHDRKLPEEQLAIAVVVPPGLAV